LFAAESDVARRRIFERHRRERLSESDGCHYCASGFGAPGIAGLTQLGASGTDDDEVDKYNASVFSSAAANALDPEFPAAHA
jgi:hypothetical protein